MIFGQEGSLQLQARGFWAKGFYRFLRLGSDGRVSPRPWASTVPRRRRPWRFVEWPSMAQMVSCVTSKPMKDYESVMIFESKDFVKILQVCHVATTARFLSGHFWQCGCSSSFTLWLNLKAWASSWHLQHCQSCEIANNIGMKAAGPTYTSTATCRVRQEKFCGAPNRTLCQMCAHQVSKSGISQDGSVKTEFHKLHGRKTLGLIVYHLCWVMLVYCSSIYVGSVVCVVMFVAAFLGSVTTVTASYCHFSSLLHKPA